MRHKYLHKRPLSPHIKTISFTREQSRSWSMMQPIGNPNCDTYNDPISATLSIAAMGGTYAAAGSFAAMSFAQGMVFAGSALSLAGNVTGNESLMKIGNGIALVGGVTMGVEALAESISPSGSITTPGASDVASSQTLAQAPTIGNQTQVFADPTLTNQPLSLSQGTQTAAYGNPQGVGLIKNANVPASNMTMADKVLASQNTANTGKMSGFMDYINKNPGPAMIMASTIAPAVGSIADYASGATQAEMDALKADAEYKRAIARAKEEELALQQLQRDRLNDPTRYSRGIINARRDPLR